MKLLRSWRLAELVMVGDELMDWITRVRVRVRVEVGVGEAAAVAPYAKLWQCISLSSIDFAQDLQCDSHSLLVEVEAK